MRAFYSMFLVSPPLQPLQPLGLDTLTWCGGMVGLPRREQAKTGVCVLRLALHVLNPNLGRPPAMQYVQSALCAIPLSVI